MYHMTKKEELAAASLDNRRQLVREDIERAKKGESTCYRDIDPYELAELLGIEDLDDLSGPQWQRFNAMGRMSLDDWFFTQGATGEDLAWIVENASMNKYIDITQELISKAASLEKESSREDIVAILGNDLTDELENLINKHELSEQASNGILGKAIWTYEFPDGYKLRFEAQIGDLGQVEDLFTPYDDAKGLFSDNEETHVIDWY